MMGPNQKDARPDIRPAAAPRERPGLCLTSMMQVDFGAISHVGKVRKNNEDHYLVARLGRSIEPLATNIPPDILPGQLTEAGYGLVVADGMGGAAAGEVASRVAIGTLVNLVADTAKWGRRIDEAEADALMDRLEGYYKAIHSALIHEAEVNPEISGMGTTLTIAYNVCSDLFVAHVGDSRAYLFRDGQLQRLTRDHTVAQRLADNRQIPQEAVAKHRFRHLLTNVLGGQSGPIQTELQHFQLADQDRLLLCSDGLTDMVDDASITAVLHDVAPPNDAAQKLLDLALEAGGRDNITIVLARYSFPSGSALRGVKP